MSSISSLGATMPPSYLDQFNRDSQQLLDDLKYLQQLPYGETIAQMEEDPRFTKILADVKRLEADDINMQNSKNPIDQEVVNNTDGLFAAIDGDLNDASAGGESLVQAAFSGNPDDFATELCALVNQSGQGDLNQFESDINNFLHKH